MGGTLARCDRGAPIIVVAWDILMSSVSDMIAAELTECSSCFKYSS